MKTLQNYKNIATKFIPRLESGRTRAQDVDYHYYGTEQHNMILSFFANLKNWFK